MAPAAAYLNRGQAALADASRAHWKAAGWPDADPIRKMADGCSSAITPAAWRLVRHFVPGSAAFRAAEMKDSREAGRHRLSAGK